MLTCHQAAIILGITLAEDGVNGLQISEFQLGGNAGRPELTIKAWPPSQRPGISGVSPRASITIAGGQLVRLAGLGSRLNKVEQATITATVAVRQARLDAVIEDLRKRVMPRGKLGGNLPFILSDGIRAHARYYGQLPALHSWLHLDLAPAPVPVRPPGASPVLGGQNAEAVFALMPTASGLSSVQLYLPGGASRLLIRGHSSVGGDYVSLPKPVPVRLAEPELRRHWQRLKTPSGLDMLDAFAGAIEELGPKLRHWIGDLVSAVG